MKNRKILITLLLIVALLFTITSQVFAAGSFSATLTPDSSSVQKGGEVTVTLKLSGINVDGGINVLTAALKYDSNILSTDLESIKTAQGWSVDYNSQTTKIVFDSANTTTNDIELATIKFKVNENTTASTAAIQLVSIEGSNADLEDTVKISDVTIQVKIGSTSTLPSTSPTTTGSPTSTATSSPTSTATNSPSSTTTSSPTSTTTSVPTTTAPGSGSQQDIPYAGAEDYILPLMVIIAVLGIASFIGYKKIDIK